jgi:hypothetical protein
MYLDCVLRCDCHVFVRNTQFYSDLCFLLSAPNGRGYSNLPGFTPGRVFHPVFGEIELIRHQLRWQRVQFFLVCSSQCERDPRAHGCQYVPLARFLPQSCGTCAVHIWLCLMLLP